MSLRDLYSSLFQRPKLLGRALAIITRQPPAASNEVVAETRHHMVRGKGLDGKILTHPHIVSGSQGNEVECVRSAFEVRRSAQEPIQLVDDIPRAKDPSRLELVNGAQ